MNIQGIPVGSVVTASGVQGFGDGYWYHRYLKPFGLNFTGATDICKTITVEERPGPPDGPGYMEVAYNGITPTELFPKCIYVDLLRGITLNAVGLVNPGITKLLECGILQRRKGIWIMSFMATSTDDVGAQTETEEFVAILKPHLRDFQGTALLEVNFSCPNAGLDPNLLINRIGTSLQTLRELDLPQGAKLNQVIPPTTAKLILDDPNCEFLGGYNTWPLPKIPNNINVPTLLHGPSPSRKRGIPEDGGASGGPFLESSLRWYKDVRAAGATKALIGGLGILSPHDAVQMYDVINQPGCEASAVAIGSMSFLRSYNIAPTIRAIQKRSAR